jgi:hypothetical protein
MDDRDFFDELYQLWFRTTGVEDRFWMPEAHFDNSGRFNVFAVGEDESRKLIASGMSDNDSDFLTAIHGCFGDLWRRLHSALDEADAADLDRDSRECRIYELEAEVAELRQVVENLSTDPPWSRHG